MTKRRTMMLVAAAFLAAPAVFAEMQTAPAAPKSASSTPVKAVVATEGTLASIDVASAQPSLVLKGTGAQQWTIYLDKKATSVWEANKPVGLAQLKVGQKVSVRHSSMNGKETAKSIEIRA